MLIAGLDEVGRGCLAGPVVSACVVLEDGFKDERIKDSKLLSKKKREELAPYIMQVAKGVGVGVVCSLVIDKINILNAVKQAMQVALSKVNCDYDLVIADAVKLNNIKKEFIHPTKADRDYICVSAASIVAKVYRDNLMETLSGFYPNYNWAKNAGYGTAEHIAAIKEFGAVRLHRKTFIRNII